MNRKTQEIIEKAEKLAEPIFKVIDNDIALYNQRKVLNAFREHRVATRHFSGTTGYGYDDIARDTLSAVLLRCLVQSPQLFLPILCPALML